MQNMISQRGFRCGFFAAAFVYFPLVPAHAQGTIFSTLDDGRSAIMDGPITQTTAADFANLLAEHPSLEALMLNSQGGLVMQALDISAAVSALGISTFISETSTCASACSIIFFAGSSRSAKGRLGVHQMSNVSASGAQLVLADVLDAFERDGVDRRVSRHMLTTLPSDMYFFEDYQKTQYGINRSANEVILAQPVIKSRAKGWIPVGGRIVS